MNIESGLSLCSIALCTFFDKGSTEEEKIGDYLGIFLTLCWEKIPN